MQPRFSCHAHGALLAIVLLAGGWQARAQPLDDPPEWADEPPVLSRWLEEGYEAEVRRQPHRAALAAVADRVLRQHIADV